MYDEMVKALRCEQYGDDECLNVECPYWSDLGCRNGVANREAADAIERLQAEVEQWKQAWKTANTLYEQMKDENVRLKKELDRQMSICGR